MSLALEALLVESHNKQKERQKAQWRERGVNSLSIKTTCFSSACL